MARSLIAVGWLQQRDRRHGRGPGVVRGGAAAAPRAWRRTSAPAIRSRPSWAWLTSGLVDCLQDTGKPAEALASYERALAIQQKLADAHPAVTQFQSDLGTRATTTSAYLLDADRQAGRGAARAERALAIRQKLADANPAVTQFQSDLAASHHYDRLRTAGTGKPAEALAAYERALAIRQKLADANPTVTEFQTNLADSHQHHRLGAASRPASRPRRWRRSSGPSRSCRSWPTPTPASLEWQSELAIYLGYVGGIHLEAGRTAEAVASYAGPSQSWSDSRSRNRSISTTWPAVTPQLAGLARRARLGDDGSRGAGRGRPGHGMAPASRRRRLPNAGPHADATPTSTRCGRAPTSSS